MTLQHLFNVNDESAVIPVIAYEEGDDLIHTPEHPFCDEEGCPFGGPPLEDGEQGEQVNV